MVLCWLIFVQVFCHKSRTRKIGCCSNHRRCSVRGVFLWVLRNFYEHFFLQNTSGRCFWYLKRELLRRRISKGWTSPFNDQCPSQIETSQLICSANQLAGPYMRGTLVVKGLIMRSQKFLLIGLLNSLVENDHIIENNYMTKFSDEKNSPK